MYVLGIQKNKRKGKLKMAAEAAENLLKECKSIIEKYQAKSMYEKNIIYFAYRFSAIYLL